MSDIIELPEKQTRRFIPKNFKVEKWIEIDPFYQDLLSRKIQSKEALMQWFLDRSELEAILSEDMGWRYIRMTCDTENEELRNRFNYFVQEIQPKIAPLSHKLNEKALNSPYLDQLDESGFDVLIRSLRKEFEIFREENIPLFTELQTESQKFGQISGAMTVEIDGKEMTLQQAAVLLQSTDRKIREEVYHKISNRRLTDCETLDKLYSKLITLRNKVAKNADFENYRDYMFDAMGRFDYKPKDCFNFHQSVEQAVVPLLDELSKQRKVSLGLETLRPWDKAVDVTGKPALKPFKTSEDLVMRTIECFTTLDPYLGECLAVMRKMGHLDLDSRKGKAPGGYNYPLAETGVPFIFMNATSTLRDMVTLLHEGGHAVHSFLTRNLKLNEFKNTPSEVAELASMSMELISMDHWDLFFDTDEDLKRAKREHLEQIIETLPWVATIDKFQHWIYERPAHSEEERRQAWIEIFNTFSDNITDWSGLEDNKNYLWQKQLHLYEVPFYYIEYGMAQLGAIAIWKNYREDPAKGLRGYLEALKLGYTRSIPEVYAAANIKFDFSKEYISALINTVKEELEELN